MDLKQAVKHLVNEWLS